ncbi:hypothetical protein TNCV_4952681 [Trichonephila clavipes]|nr:hypothetical protein TNCV_4952681 [Trichonephila clavipes]
MTMPDHILYVLDVSQQNNVEILPHLSYSPDLIPYDLWLFPQLKKPLQGKRFASDKSEANPQVYVETPLHPEKLTVWCALWAGGILLQNR